MLNSNIIDVDILDYLIHDSYMSGYSSISIDYKRLLSGVFINNGDSPVGYERSSLSVLENVLMAHDMERRWIQSHPIVQYEAFLLQTIIRELNSKYYKKGKLFSYDSITSLGQSMSDIGKIRLLSDADILFWQSRISIIAMLLKNITIEGYIVIQYGNLKTSILPFLLILRLIMFLLR